MFVVGRRYDLVITINNKQSTKNLMKNKDFKSETTYKRQLLIFAFNNLPTKSTEFICQKKKKIYIYILKNPEQNL